MTASEIYLEAMRSCILELHGKSKERHQKKERWGVVIDMQAARLRLRGRLPVKRRTR